MRSITSIVSTLVIVGSALASLEAADYGLSERDTGNQAPYSPCKEQKGCASGEVCFTSRKDGSNVCARQVPGKCSYTYACLKLHKGLACHKGHCYDVKPTREAGESCDVGHTCKGGMSCLSNQCRKTRGSACSASSECRPDEPCTNGKCGYAAVGEPCKQGTLDCGPYLFYCSKNKGNTCQKKGGVNGVCEVGGCSRNLDCVAGTCQRRGYGKACKSSQECPNGLLCKNDKCSYRGMQNDACSNGLDCEGGFICEGGKCTKVEGSTGKCVNDAECIAPNNKCGKYQKCCIRGQPNC